MAATMSTLAEVNWLCYPAWANPNIHTFLTGSLMAMLQQCLIQQNSIHLYIQPPSPFVVDSWVWQTSQHLICPSTIWTKKSTTASHIFCCWLLDVMNQSTTWFVQASSWPSPTRKRGTGLVTHTRETIEHDLLHPSSIVIVSFIHIHKMVSSIRSWLKTKIWMAIPSHYSSYLTVVGPSKLTGYWSGTSCLSWVFQISQIWGCGHWSSTFLLVWPYIGQRLLNEAKFDISFSEDDTM